MQGRNLEKGIKLRNNVQKYTFDVLKPTDTRLFGGHDATMFDSLGVSTHKGASSLLFRTNHQTLYYKQS